MLFEFFYRLVSLDTNWLVSLIGNNLHWLFLLAAYAFIQEGGKKWFWGFIFLVGSLYIALDIFEIWGLDFFPVGAWLLIAIPLEIFIENTKLEKHKSYLIWILFIVFSFIFTFFILGK